MSTLARLLRWMVGHYRGRISYRIGRGYLGGYWIEGTRRIDERDCRRFWWVSRLPICGHWHDGVLHLDEVNSDRDLPDGASPWPDDPPWHILVRTDYSESWTKKYHAQNMDERRMGALFSEGWW